MARGDHYLVKRYGYRHHGIDIGDGTVVHFTGKPGRKSDAVVQRTSWQDFTCGEPYQLITYSGSIWTPDHVCLRALRLLGLREYDLVRNNCEHFATFCKTGTARSSQIEKSISNVWKYSRFAVKHPGYIFAGPAYELARRLTMAGVDAIKSISQKSAGVHDSTPSRDDICSFFHYGDMYSLSSEAVGRYFVSPYGQWIDMTTEIALDSNDPQAHFGGQFYVDDELMGYLRTSHGLFRYAPNDNQVKFHGTIFDHLGQKYLQTEGSWAYLTAGGWSPVSRPPESLGMQAYLFVNANNLMLLRLRSGWLLQDEQAGWQLDTPFRSELRYI